jgi:fatty acid desaturase
MNSKIAKIKEMRAIASTYMHPEPMIYWCDLMISVTIGWVCFYISLKTSIYSLTFFIALTASIFSFYRALFFTHELVHLKSSDVPGFSVIWHILAGIPLLAPHFLYHIVHQEHHSKNIYGTENDAEYLAFGRSKRLIIAHLSWNIFIPLLSLLRFGLIAPLSLLNNKLRRTVMQDMSFMGLKFTHSRRLPRKTKDITFWYIQEYSCSVFAISILTLIYLDILPAALLVHWYIVLVSVLTMNSIRTLGATHWYTSNGEIMNTEEQGMDSITVLNNSLFTLLLCPVGGRYHALHHMFPSIPYHSLAKADAHLRREFPSDSMIIKTTSPSLWYSWKKLWRHTNDIC